MEIKGLSKTHQNIIKKLIKNNIVEKRIEDNYNLYTTNKKYLDNERFFFSDCFNLCNEKEFLIFEENLKYNILNILVEKLKKRIFKNKLQWALSNYEVVYSIQQILFDKMNGDISRLFKIIKENIISQDNINDRFVLINILRNMIETKNINYEYVYSEIKKEEKRLNKNLIFKETKKKGVYLFIGNSYSKNLIHKITPSKYCINYNSYFEYCSTPYSIIFNFNENVAYEDSLYFSYISGETKDSLDLAFYNRKNEEPSESIKSDLTRLILDGKTLREYEIESKYNFYENSLITMSWVLSDIYFNDNKDSFDFYFTKFKKDIPNFDIKNFEKYFLYQIKRYLYYYLKNIYLFEGEEINKLKNKIEKVRDINFNDAETHRIFDLISKRIERVDIDFNEYKRTRPIIKRLLLNKSFENRFKESFKEIYIGDNYNYYFDFYLEFNIQDYILEKDKEVLKDLIMTSFKDDLKNKFIDNLKTALNYLKEKILNDVEFQDLLITIIDMEEDSSRILYIISEMNEENQKLYYLKTNLKDKIVNNIINKEEINDKLSEDVSSVYSLIQELPDEMDNDLFLNNVLKTR